VGGGIQSIFGLDFQILGAQSQFSDFCICFLFSDSSSHIFVCLSSSLIWVSSGFGVGRKLLKMKTNAYIPDFKFAFECFCIHAGGRAVLDELEKNIRYRNGLLCIYFNIEDEALNQIC